MLSRVFTTREQVMMVACASAILIGGVTYGLTRPRQPAEVVVQKPAIPVPQPAHAATATAPSAELTSVPPPAPATPSPARKISVSVTGAVTTPGVYELDDHTRVEDALAAAGGATDAADVSDINEAAELLDGSALVIPVAGRAGIEDGKRLVLRSGESAAALNPPEYTISGWRHSARTRPTAPAASGTHDAPAPAARSTGAMIDLNTATAEELATLPGIGPKLAEAIVEYRARQPFQSVDDLNNVSGIGEKRLADLRPHVRVGP